MPPAFQVKSSHERIVRALKGHLSASVLMRLRVTYKQVKIGEILFVNQEVIMMKASVARFTLLCVGLAFASLVLPSVSDAQLDMTGVLALWLFEEGKGTTVTDSSGNGHDGEFRATPEWVEGRSGRGALHFPAGGENWVAIRTSNLANNDPVIPETVDITMGIWVKPGGTQNTHANILASHNGYRGISFEQIGDDVNRFNVPIGTAGADDALRAQWVYNTLDASGNDIATQLVTDEWNHFVVTKAGNHTTQYLNGEVSAESDIHEGPVLVPDRFYIGSGRTWSDDSGRWFNGTVDDAFLFTRALTQDEIKGIMVNGLIETSTAVSPANKIATVWGRIKARHQ